jgi:hypothetical protein
MNHPAARKKHMGVGLFVLVLLGCLLLVGLTGCSGGERYQVDYCGSKDCYSNAKDSYRAGTEVTLYFDLVATDTDYSFLLDGEPIHYTYDDQKGFVIQFTMPDHDVKLEYDSRNSMLPMGDGWTDSDTDTDTGFTGIGNPLTDSTLEELAEETGYTLTLPEETFQNLSVTRIAGEPALYSVEFLYNEDGNCYTFRLQRDPTAGDISGMYYAWTEQEVTESHKLYWAEDEQGICLWQDEHAAFSIAMTENAASDALLQMKDLMVQSLIPTE